MSDAWKKMQQGAKGKGVTETLSDIYNNAKKDLYSLIDKKEKKKKKD